MGVRTEVRTWHDGMLEFGMDSKHPSENHEFSILGEMVIKGKDSIDIKALHQSKGCAIRKTKTFIFVLAEDSPSSLLIFFGYSNQSRDFLIPQLLAKWNCD